MISLCLKAGTFGTDSFFGYFIIVILTSFYPLKTGITQTRRCSPQNTLLPFLILLCADVGKGNAKTRTVSWHCPAKAAALGQSPKPCSLLTVGLVFFPPLGGGGGGSGSRGMSIWFGLVFFRSLFERNSPPTPRQKLGSICQAH